MRDPDPCDECGAAPAVAHGLCHACLSLAEQGEGGDEPEDREATDEDLAAAESAWERWRTQEPI